MTWEALLVLGIGACYTALFAYFCGVAISLRIRTKCATIAHKQRMWMIDHIGDACQSQAELNMLFEAFRATTYEEHIKAVMNRRPLVEIYATVLWPAAKGAEGVR